jgi:peptide deformylase
MGQRINEWKEELMAFLIVCSIRTYDNTCRFLVHCCDVARRFVRDLPRHIVEGGRAVYTYRPQSCRARWSCYFLAFALVASYAPLLRNTYNYNNNNKSDVLGGLGATIPLAPRFLDAECYPFDTTTQKSVAMQTYKNRTLLEYVRWMHVHMVRERMVGITAFHVGLPFCLIAFYENDNVTVRTLINPAVVSAAHTESGAKKRDASSSLVVLESDVLCPDVPPVRRLRSKVVTIEFDDFTDHLVVATITTDNDKRRRRRQERFDAGSAIIVQHLIDAIERRGVCNKQ